MDPVSDESPCASDYDVAMKERGFRAGEGRGRRGFSLVG